MQQNQSFFDQLARYFVEHWEIVRGWFGQEQSQQKEDKRRLEPKYWPEVMDLMDTLNKLIESHTIDDINIRHVNTRILEYLEEQINTKGTLSNLDQRYSALDTVADRFLTNSLNKIVGLKHQEDSHAEFSEAISIFKKRLRERKDQELKQH
jgi:hypothetical protein